MSGCFQPAANISHAQVYGWEALGTLFFIIPIFAVIWFSIRKSGYGNTGPFIIGCSFIANALAVGPYTGAAFNPARLVASPVVFKCPHNHNVLYYILGEFTGGVLSPILIIPWYGISATSWYFRFFPSLKEVSLNTKSCYSPTSNTIEERILKNEHPILNKSPTNRLINFDTVINSVRSSRKSIELHLRTTPVTVQIEQEPPSMVRIVESQ